MKKHTPVYAVFYSGLDTYYEQVYITQGNKDVSQLATFPDLAQRLVFEFEAN